MNYMNGIWAARHFWLHLALSDLRARWRRSFLGMSWSVVQPLGMTLLLAFVFGKIFNSPIVEYAPYILSGMVVWEFVTTSAIGGSLSFVVAETYIKQCNHPLSIYTLRTVLGNTITLTLASLSLVIWVLIASPQNFGWTWLAALTIYPILLLMAWPLATLLAYMGTRFRDVPHALTLVLQALWLISPIYFEAKVFRQGSLHVLIDYNPIYHLLQIIRAPLLQGQWPTLENYAYCFAMIVVFSLLAWLVGRRAEKEMIFYL